MFPAYQRHLVYKLSASYQCQYVQHGEDRGDGVPPPRGPGREAEAAGAPGTFPYKTFCTRSILFHIAIYIIRPFLVAIYFFFVNTLECIGNTSKKPLLADVSVFDTKPVTLFHIYIIYATNHYILIFFHTHTFHTLQ